MSKLHNIALILLKLADNTDNSSVHLNISSTMKKLQICILFRSNRRKLSLCYLFKLCYLLFYLVWWHDAWPRFLISKQHFHWFLLIFGILTENITTKNQDKKWLKFWYRTKIRVGLKWKWSNMLWIMSGTYNSLNCI